MDPRQQKSIDYLVAAIEKAYLKPGQLMWRSFLSGLLSGLGATLGVAIVLALSAFLIHYLGGLPVIGNWISNVGQYLPRGR